MNFLYFQAICVDDFGCAHSHAWHMEALADLIPCGLCLCYVPSVRRIDRILYTKGL